MDLEEDGGTCNAILYDRESKVENDTNWCWYDNEHNQGLPNGWGKACESPNRGHWSEGRLEQVIFSTNSVDIGNRNFLLRGMSTLQLYLALLYQWLLPQCLVRCRQEDRSWIHLGNPIGHLPQVNLGLKLVIFSHDKAYPKLTQFLIPLSHGTHPWFAMDLDHWAVAT